MQYHQEEEEEEEERKKKNLAIDYYLISSRNLV
jgi:hypothetical protein